MLFWGSIACMLPYLLRFQDEPEESEGALNLTFMKVCQTACGGGMPTGGTIDASFLVIEDGISEVTAVCLAGCA